MRVMMPRSSRSIRHYVQTVRTEAPSLSGSLEASPVKAAQPAAEESLALLQAAVASARSEVIPCTPTNTFVRRVGTPTALLNSDVVAAPQPANWEAGPMATPKNGDRRDMEFSLRLGAPAFKGSIAEPGRAAPAVNAQPRVLAAPVGWKPPTPAGVPTAGVCFRRA
eukprot:TRINITY_DN22317_c0_g1_i2.p1 TRINITY_DN22317_c0_g1~~TRINITY_DN22317_c0_g1_i2.p1  ORF type:complete len:166 (+),score=20.00 TRINITY_DN22317_c0_g1_i2:340-837(+)